MLSWRWSSTDAQSFFNALVVLFITLLAYVLVFRGPKIVSHGDLPDIPNNSGRSRAKKELLQKLFQRRTRRFVFPSTNETDLPLGLSCRRIETQVLENISGRPLGTVVWDGALVLCEYLARLRDDWTGVSVLDLGSGTGIVGLHLAQRGAIADLTDLDMLLPLLTDNLRGSGLSAEKARVWRLRWGEDSDVDAAESQNWDVIVGADIMYVEEHVFDELCSSLRRLIRGQTVAFLSGSRRHKAQDSSYVDRLRETFHVEAVDLSGLHATGLGERKGSDGPNADSKSRNVFAFHEALTNSISTLFVYKVSALNENLS